jgi:hypothetical protein
MFGKNNHDDRWLEALKNDLSLSYGRNCYQACIQSEKGHTEEVVEEGQEEEVAEDGTWLQIQDLK